MGDVTYRKLLFQRLVRRYRLIAGAPRGIFSRPYSASTGENRFAHLGLRVRLVRDRAAALTPAHARCDECEPLAQYSKRLGTKLQQLLDILARAIDARRSLPVGAGETAEIFVAVRNQQRLI